MLHATDLLIQEGKRMTRMPTLPATPDTCDCGEPIGEGHIEPLDGGYFQVVWDCPKCGNVYIS